MSGKSAGEANLRFDVIALGETMLRLTPPGCQRFEQASVAELHVGGSESNTAVGLSRLGHRVAWLSRLTDNPLGHMIAGALRAHRVDCSMVVWTPEDRVGTYYMERGKSPRGSQVFYDRAGSAMSRIQPEDLPEALFSSAQMLHTTGITLGISDSARRSTERAIQMAKRSGVRISFDVNYRAKLWPPQQAADACDAVAKQSDYVFIPLRDTQTLFGLEQSDPDSVLKSLRARWPSAVVVLTMGSQGSCAIAADGTSAHAAGFPVEQEERLGGGDAFSAGFLSGVLRGEALEDSLRRGNAAAAIKYTLPGDLPVFDASQVDELLRSAKSPTNTSHQNSSQVPTINR